MAGRQAALAPVLKPLQARLDFARRNQDKNAMLSAYMEMKKVNSKAGIKYSTIFYPTLIQTPLGFGSFVLTRRMGELPVPGLDTSGFLWINDLTIGDPTYLLPALSGGLMYLSFKVKAAYLWLNSISLIIHNSKVVNSAEQCLTTRKRWRRC